MANAVKDIPTMDSKIITDDWDGPKKALSLNTVNIIDAIVIKAKFSAEDLLRACTKTQIHWETASRYRIITEAKCNIAS